MEGRSAESGFTAVELLVTLFVAALFLFSGYQLFNVVLSNGTDSRNLASASNFAYTYVRKYQPSATDPCTAQSPVVSQSVTISGLANPTVSVAITCPTPSAPSMSRVEATVQYSSGSETKSVIRAVLVDAS